MASPRGEMTIASGAGRRVSIRTPPLQALDPNVCPRFVKPLPESLLATRRSPPQLRHRDSPAQARAWMRFLPARERSLFENRSVPPAMQRKLCGAAPVRDSLVLLDLPPWQGGQVPDAAIALALDF